MNRLAGKTAVITGASRGIGRAIAERMAREGARLVLNGRQDSSALREAEAACRALGAEVATAVGDIAGEGVAQAICGEAVSRFGALDVLVNNAGVAGGDFLALVSEEDVDRMISTNILGLLRMSRAAIRPMLEQRSGCIINLSSVLATQPGRGSTVYAGTKGFVESFTRALAVELGKKNIRVNAVAPGIIETEMSDEVRAREGDALRERIALKRFGRPEEVASVVAFLASGDGAYISGAVLPVDGAFGSP